jgi:cell division protein FtsQ
VAVKRDQGRRRLHRLLAVLGVLMLPVVGVAALRSPLLDVDTVTVDAGGSAGVEAVARETAAAAGVATGAQLIDVDPGAVVAALLARPEIAAAHVERAWPATVTITVTPRVPAAIMALTSGSIAFVAEDGVVVAEAPAAPAGLVTITGVRPPAVGERVDSERGRAALAVAAALPPPLAARVAEVHARASGDVELELAADGGTVRLGPAADLASKLDAVGRVLAQVDLACLDTIDVRVPLSPVATRLEGCGQ